MRKMTVKLVLAFLAVALVGIVLVALLSGWSTERSFLRFALQRRLGEVEEALADYHAARGGWGPDVVELLQSEDNAQPFGRGRGQPLGLADADGISVVGGAGYRPGERVSAEDLAAGRSIVVGDEPVGMLLIGPFFRAGPLAERDFVGQMRSVLFLGGLGAAAVALVLGLVLARGFTRPLRQLTAASRAIAAGDLDTRVSVRSHDEIEQLADAFNRMAADLAQAEDARRQQTADIAHELRTPLTVIQGHLEALADGIFPADAEHLDPVLEQTRLLGRLVEDLRTLSLAEAGRLALTRIPTDAGEWAEGVVYGFRTFAAEREIALELRVADDLPWVEIDPQRLAQVLGNLLDNALRYTPQGGQVLMRLDRGDGEVLATVADSGPGVSPEDLPHLFERFWRGDRSRSRRTGGSGLGLTIARQIVEAHGGRIWAERAAGGGLQVIFSLPVA